MIYSLKKGSGKKGWIVIVHGLGEHSGRYEKFINMLVEKEFGVITFDLPGHGKSKGKRGDVTIEDSIEIINNLTKDLGNFHIFGHSLGGLIAIRYAQENVDRIKTLVASSPALYLKPSFAQKLLLNIFSYIYPSLTIGNGIDPYLLSRNKEAVERYINDELVHDKISVRLGKSLLENIQLAHQKVKVITKPTRILVGTEDKITPPVGSYSFFEKLDVSDNKKILKKYEGAFHEIFEDPEYQQIFYQDILQWFESFGGEFNENWWETGR